MLVAVGSEFERVNLLQLTHVPSATVVNPVEVVSPTLDHLLEATAVVNAQAFGAHTIAPQPAKQLAPAGFVNASVIHSPTIQHGAAPPAWNPSDKTANVTLSNADKTATANAGGHGGVRGAILKTTGKWYFEQTVGPVAGADTGAGLANASAVLANIGDVAAGAFIQFKSGNVYLNGAGGIFAGGNMGGGGVQMVAYDAGNHRAWMRFELAGGGLTAWNGNPSADPATNVGGIDMTSIDTTGLMPCWCCGASADAVTANFGTSAFTHAMPSGFSAWT
jgi:hypothetical protein